MPSPGEIYNLFGKYASQGRDFIYYSFSSELSGTYQVSKIIIEELKKDYPNVKMEVIDTKSGSFASGLIALQGAKLAEAGASFKEIVEISKENTENIEHVFTIDDLNWLLKGGRISKSSAIIGSALNIKPILDVQKGKMIVIEKNQREKKSLKYCSRYSTGQN